MPGCAPTARPPRRPPGRAPGPSGCASPTSVGCSWRSARLACPDGCCGRWAAPDAACARGCCASARGGRRVRRGRGADARATRAGPARRPTGPRAPGPARCATWSAARGARSGCCGSWSAVAVVALWRCGPQLAGDTGRRPASGGRPAHALVVAAGRSSPPPASTPGPGTPRPLPARSWWRSSRRAARPRGRGVGRRARSWCSWHSAGPPPRRAARAVAARAAWRAYSPMAAVAAGVLAATGVYLAGRQVRDAVDGVGQHLRDGRRRQGAAGRGALGRRVVHHPRRQPRPRRPGAGQPGRLATGAAPAQADRDRARWRCWRRGGRGGPDDDRSHGARGQRGGTPPRRSTTRWTASS